MADEEYVNAFYDGYSQRWLDDKVDASKSRTIRWIGGILIAVVVGSLIGGAWLSGYDIGSHAAGTNLCTGKP